MSYEERLQHVSVLGAAGKMGSGILLLTAVEMADLSLKPENKDLNFVLHAIDISQAGLKGLVKYLQAQILKIAEKKIVQLRKVYADRADLVDNSDIINQYILDVLVVIKTTTRSEAAWDSTLVFEAIKEDPEVKKTVLASINRNNPNKPWFFTNTSSIPISKLDSMAGLEGRIIGFHFYNPPAVQKLVEVIRSSSTLQELNDFALQYAKSLKKTVVPSNDVAGFIGNGHFMRDLIYGTGEVEKLARNYPLPEAIFMINKITQDYLVRPMGIFQLIDYVGIDVCQYILSVMQPYMGGENLRSELLDRLAGMGVKGGQYSDGSQKDGFLKYEKNRPVAVFAPDKAEYVNFTDLQETCDTRLGTPPADMPTWKNVIRDARKEEKFKTWFGSLKTTDTLGAKLAVAYAEASRSIGRKLVSDGVAANENDVNTVLLTGFFHAYGPINDYV